MSRAALLATLPQVGRVTWIGLAPEKRAPITPVQAVWARVGTGLDGDHHARRGGRRQVTLIQAEHLPVIAACVGLDAVDPALLRRNVAIAGINLWALHDRRFRVGGVLLQGTGECDPCERMEAALGPGGFNAMQRHGGITAIVLEAGEIRVGDAVVVAP